MAKILNNLLDKIDALKNKVDTEAGEILEVLDVDKVIDNPREYLEDIASQFIESYEDEMEEAKVMGENYARSILKNVQINKR